ncbi:MAG: hypothetical protein ACI9SP_004562 [Arenicella sp.]|jgi:hypothetical protein
MLNRRNVRSIFIEILIDDKTNNGPNCEDIGLTNALHRVLDTHLDPLSVVESDNEMPLIAVYADRDSRSPRDKYLPAIMDQTITMIVECYETADNGYDLEDKLDELESQVLHKLITDTRFVDLGGLLSFDSNPMRDGDGHVIGVRSLSFVIKAVEEIKKEICDPNFKHIFKEVSPRV